MKVKKHVIKSYRKLLAHPNPWLRRGIGLGLVLGGIVGPVLPVLGFWMLPLGVIVLIIDWPKLKPIRRRYNAWWKKKLSRNKTAGKDSDATRDPGP